MPSNNHPRRALLPYKVRTGSDTRLWAAFRNGADAMEWAQKESRGNSITFIVSGPDDFGVRFFRGEAFDVTGGARG